VVFEAIPLGSAALATVAAVGLLAVSVRRGDRALAWLGVAVVLAASAVSCPRLPFILAIPIL
jgi:hypothetical protein